ncbi:MAG: hypothetical protein LAP21_06900 [Acidobacteriia bacterium]|nr:hypothetical protein [Terriglobia bacterium]
MFKTVINRVAAFLMETAVLYFLSCCLALLGVYSMMKSPLLAGGLLPRYFEAYGTFFVYVVMLTVFGLLVLRRLALPVDGLVLAGLALLLVLDPVFFNDVFYTFNPQAGMLAGTISLVLGMGLYFALIRFGGVPWTKNAAAMIVLSAIFVSYYPAGLSIPWPAEAKGWYFYWLWWAPLAIVMVCQPGRSVPEISGGAAIPAPMRKWFIRACAIIVFYIVYSHLLEAGYAYALPFHAMYLTPGFMAMGLLICRMRQLDSDRWRLVWVCGLAAAFCAAMKADNLLIRLLPGVALSPFRCGLIAVALFFLYCWKKSGEKEYEDRSWAVAAAILLLFVVSGNSLTEALSSVAGLHFVPFFYLALVLGIFAAFTETSVIPTLAGWAFLIAVIALLPVRGADPIGAFYQAGVIWFGLVQWRYHGRARPWAYSVAGAFAYSISVIMWLVGHQPEWVADYLVLVVCMFFAGKALKNAFLWTLSVLGMLAAPLYLARSPLGSVIMELRRVFGFGTLMTMFAFLMLPMAYCMSVMKKGRQT